MSLIFVSVILNFVPEQNQNIEKGWLHSVMTFTYLLPFQFQSIDMYIAAACMCDHN